MPTLSYIHSGLWFQKVAVKSLESFLCHCKIHCRYQTLKSMLVNISRLNPNLLFAASHWTFYFESVTKCVRSNIISICRNVVTGTFSQYFPIFCVTSVFGNESTGHRNLAVWMNKILSLIRTVRKRPLDWNCQSIGSTLSNKLSIRLVSCHKLFLLLSILLAYLDKVWSLINVSLECAVSCFKPLPNECQFCYKYIVSLSIICLKWSIYTVAQKVLGHLNDTLNGLNVISWDYQGSTNLQMSATGLLYLYFWRLLMVFGDI